MPSQTGEQVHDTRPTVNPIVAMMCCDGAGAMTRNTDAKVTRWDKGLLLQAESALGVRSSAKQVKSKAGADTGAEFHKLKRKSEVIRSVSRLPS